MSHFCVQIGMGLAMMIEKDVGINCESMRFIFWKVKLSENK